MSTSWVRGLALATLTAALATGGSGCYVDPGPVYAEGYQPVFYEHHVVYYDALGHPYYHVNGAAVWVPATSPRYVYLSNHWLVYGPKYPTWVERHGYRYWRR